MSAGAPGRIRRCVAGALVAACCWSCTPSGSPPPSILLVSIDTLRRDHVSAYGEPFSLTPGLDGLAREGALFERAVSSSNWTLPAHVSLLTGLSPGRHGVVDERDKLPADVRSLAEALHEAGYATAGFASHIYLDARYGFDRGFDAWDVHPEQRAEQVSERAIGWLESHADAPFFLFLHYFDPHWNYDPPDAFWRRFGAPPRQHGKLARLFRYRDPELDMPPELRRDVLALYAAEVAYTDASVAQVLDWLRERGRLDTTLVAVVSDHGEEFGEHGGFGHGSHLYSELTSIPLLLRYPPRIPAGTRRGDLAGLVDLPATLLDLAGLAVEPQFEREGRALFGSPAGTERSLVAESTRNGPRRLALQRGPYALLGAGSYRPVGFAFRNGKVDAFEGEPLPLAAGLFDLRSDPGEQRNHLDDPALAEAAGALGDALRRYADETAAGLLLRCGPEAGDRVSGRVGFAAPLSDQPWGLDPHGTARARELSPTRFEVELEPRDGVATLVFPTSAQPGDVELELDAAPGSCRLERRAAARPEADAVDLSDEERARLRALGYVD